MRNKLKINQWKSARKTINWLTNTNNKEECSFVQMDIKALYPSIKEHTLNNALDLSKQHISVPNGDLHTIKHCKKCILYDKNKIWLRKCNTNNDTKITNLT